VLLPDRYVRAIISQQLSWTVIPAEGMSVTTGHMYMKTWFSGWEISFPRISHKSARVWQIVLLICHIRGLFLRNSGWQFQCWVKSILSISFSTRRCTARHKGGPVTSALLFDHKTNENILKELKTHAVFVQINNRNNRQTDRPRLRQTVMKCQPAGKRNTWRPINRRAVCSAGTGTGH
jgi:hypothetical protein